MSRSRESAALLSGLDYLHAFDLRRALALARPWPASRDLLTAQAIRAHLARKAAIEARSSANLVAS